MNTHQDSRRRAPRLSREEKDSRSKARAAVRAAIKTVANAERAVRLQGTGYQSDHTTPAGMRPHGWTESSITAFLGQPDRLATNPHYKCGSAMRLYLTSRVLAAQGSDAFKSWLQKGKQRRKGAEQAVTTKRKKLMKYVHDLNIVVPLVQDVQTHAIESYNTWNSGSAKYASGTDSAAFLERITVNFIRHTTTDYEFELSEIFGKVGIETAREELRDKIYDEIAEVYPYLASECSRQSYTRSCAA